MIYSAGRDLDVIPSRAGKGNALAWVLTRMREHGVPPRSVLVCGDSGNDIELFRVPGVRGCVVGNAMPELVEFAERYVRGQDALECATTSACPVGGCGPGVGLENPIYRAKAFCAGGILEALGHFGYIQLPNSN